MARLVMALLFVPLMLAAVVFIALATAEGECTWKRPARIVRGAGS